MKCPFCKKKINRYDGHHIYKCDKNSHFRDKIEIKYQYLLFNHPIISVKNNLFNEYVVKIRSLPDIKKEYGINYNNIIFLLDYFDIGKRSLKKSSKMISIKKYKKTCLHKYGTDNYSKLKTVRKEDLSSNQLYGNKEQYDQLKDIISIQKNNILKLIYENENILKKETKKLYSQYYKYWYNLSDEKKDELINKSTSLETKISDIMDKLNMSYVKHFNVGEKIFDFKIDTYLLVDVNSDFWHANPLVYREKDRLNFPFKKMSPRIIWDRDRIKNEYAESKKYNVVVIWESEIKDIEDDDLMKFFIEKINII